MNVENQRSRPAPPCPAPVADFGSRQADMAAMATALGALLLLSGVRRAAGACGNTTQQAALTEALGAVYEGGAAPAARVAVAARLDVRHAAVLEPDAAVRLLATLHLSWQDARLAWNASAWGCDRALLPAEQLWRPDVVLLSAGGASDGAGDAGGGVALRARVSSDGAVSWAARLDVRAPLTLDLYAWPHDQHEAIFKFGSRAHSADEMDLSINETEFGLMFGSSSWRAVSVRSSVQRWDGAGVERNVAVWVVRLRRAGGAHALAAGTVLVAAALLLLTASLLPPDARPALCAAAAFACALWLVSCAGRLAGSARVPLVLSLASAQCAVGCAGAAAAALVRRVARCSAPPPRLLRALLTATSLHCQLTSTESGQAESSAWAAAAQLLDRVLLTLLLLASFTIYCIYISNC